MFAEELYQSDDEMNLSVIDLGGLRLSQMTSEVRAMIKASLKVAASYYPGRTFRLFIVNIPTWFSVVYGIVKSVFTAQQQQKIKYFKPNATLAGLSEFIDVEQIPSGQCGCHHMRGSRWPGHRSLIFSPFLSPLLSFPHSLALLTLLLSPPPSSFLSLPSSGVRAQWPWARMNSRSDCIRT